MTGHGLFTNRDVCHILIIRLPPPCLVTGAILVWEKDVQILLIYYNKMLLKCTFRFILE